MPRSDEQEGGTALPPHLPLHIDRPGAKPVALGGLTPMAGLEVPRDVTSPMWANATIRLANDSEYSGAARILPPQRQHGAPTLARISGILVVARDRLVDPLTPHERSSLGLRARDVLPFRVMLHAELPYPLYLGERPGPLPIETWSRPLGSADVALDVSKLAPL